MAGIGSNGRIDLFQVLTYRLEVSLYETNFVELRTVCTM